MSDRHDPPPDVPCHRLETVVGRGASSTVWRGRDAAGHAVAIKVPHEAGWLADEASAPVEQHVLRTVRHPHLVRLRDVVPMSDGRVALVFDLVVGAPLKGTVRARGHLRPGEVVTVLTPLCDAVATLHGAGGLHGDISPSNVMLTAQGKPLLLDLGAARLAGAFAEDPVFGTTGFVAPEVRQGLAPREASDVFSLGALAWFCLTGNGAPDTMLRLDPDVIRSHVGEELAQVIGECIDPDPVRRPSAHDLAGLFFDAVPAEAVDVVVGADEASALTHRIRAEARDEGALPPGGPGLAGRPGVNGGLRRVRPGRWPQGRWPLGCWGKGWWQDRGSRRHQARYASASPSAPWPPTERGKPALTTTLLAGLGALASLVLGIGAMSAWWAWSVDEPVPEAENGTPRLGKLVGTGASTGPPTSTLAVPAPRSAPTPTAPRSTPTPTAASSTSAATVASRPGDDMAALLRRADAPRRAPAEVMQALSDRRASALVTRDPSRLAAVDQPSSPAWSADAATIRWLRGEGSFWRGLALEVAQAAPVATTGTRAVVRARVDWTAYAVVTAGRRVQRPAQKGQVLDFTLVRAAEGWRLAAVRPPAS